MGAADVTQIFQVRHVVMYLSRSTLYPCLLSASTHVAFVLRRTTHLQIFGPVGWELCIFFVLNLLIKWIF